jgi:protein-S-isoprenylcysteine O-methyltransferase Ste14
MSLSSSFPFHGEPLVVVTFWATFVLWVGSELFLNAKRRSRYPGVSQDRGSFCLIAVLLSVAFSLDFACALLLPSVAPPSARIMFAVGLYCVVCGTALRWYAVATLGRYFTVNVASQASQPVIDVGPYRLVRHPSYAGMLLALLGFALALGNWAGLFAMLVLPAAAFAYRIKVEEAALLSTLGEPYARYMRRTWRLIPYLI